MKTNELKQVSEQATKDLLAGKSGFSASTHPASVKTQAELLLTIADLSKLMSPEEVLNHLRAKMESNCKPVKRLSEMAEV